MYVCPMHPNVRQEGPGRCPECGMKLVDERSPQPSQHTHEEKTESYLPLIVIILLLILTTAVLAVRDYLRGEFAVRETVSDFMAAFFLVFAGFKLMDLRGFVDGYATYDLLARRVRAYGYVYPFIELAFGLLMIADFEPPALLWTEFGVMAFSGLGVSMKLAKREKFKCACLGTFLNVPLTTTTLVEDFGMAALALVLLFT